MRGPGVMVAQKYYIQTVRIDRFKCFFGDPQTVDLEAFGPGTHFVKGINLQNKQHGSNGSGKTSLFDAISWCLYGRTPDGLRNPDIKPWAGRGKTEVSLGLRCGKKRKVITRTANPNRLTVNGKDASQEYLDQLFMPFPVFTNTVLIAQEQPLFFDRRPQDKLNLFSEVLELDQWEKRSQVASEKFDDLAKKQLILAGKIRACETSIGIYKTGLEEARANMKQWSSDRQGKLGEVQGELHDECEPRMEKLQKHYDRVSLELDSALCESDGLSSKLSKLYAERRELEITHQKSIFTKQQLEADIAKMERELGKVDVKRKCPACGRPMKRSDIAKHRKGIEQKLVELREAYLQVEPAKHLEKQLKQVKKKIVRLEQSKEGFDKKARKARDKLDSVNTRLAEIKARVDELRRLVVELEDWSNPYQAQVTSNRKKLKLERTKKKKLDDRHDKRARQLERVRFWIKGFKECRLYALEEVLGDLRMVTEGLCMEMGLSDWVIEYNVESETKSGSVTRGLSINVKAPNSNRKVRWEAFSGGERQRLRLVGSLALSEVLLNYAGIDIDTEILDEPTQHLSREGIRDLCECLSARAERLGRRTFYVDHQVIESLQFASTLTVTCEKQGSVVTV